MSSIDEKRVYGTTEEKTDVFVATSLGVARVECSGDLVGGFGLVHRCAASDIAAKGNRLAVATDEDVLVWSRDEFDSTEFGPAQVVGYHDELIAAESGRIARYVENGWNVLGVSGSDRDIGVRAIDGDLLAGTNGVYRLSSSSANETRYVSAGLNDARDVSSVPIPLVATATGLYQLKNGWVNVLDGDVHLIESDGTRTHAATDEGLYVRTSNHGNTSLHHNEPFDEWERIELPVEERVAGIGYGESTYAVTVDGTFLIGSDDGWHTRSLGLSGVCGLVVR